MLQHKYLSTITPNQNGKLAMSENSFICRVIISMAAMFNACAIQLNQIAMLSAMDGNSPATIFTEIVVTFS